VADPARRLACAALLFSPLIARAALSDTIVRVKPSIVVVGTFMRSRAPAFMLRGTGFVVGNGTLVATNTHVADTALDAQKLETLAVLTIVDGQRQVREARIVASSPEHDLTLLQIDGPALPALPLGDASKVREGQSIAFIGFPIGSVLGFTPVTHRGIVSAITPIVIPVDNTSRLNATNRNFLSRGSFPVFQLDATAYPGNSGSPVFDQDSGEVVGIVNMVLVKASKESGLSQPSGITYAIPVNHLVALITAPR
jgi:S1-C subfamily serine protease